MTRISKTPQDNTMPILQIEKKGNVAVVTLDDPNEKVNKLNRIFFEELTAFLDGLKSDNSLRGALFISGKANNFVAGADIDMFAKFSTKEEFKELSRTGQEIFLRIENFPKPIVACIHGSCMGGGTELALACHYRIISDHSNTRIALPEVKLGLLPGIGGTQRLPRLIGIQQALAYLLTGKNMYSHQALKNGFADEVVDKHKLVKSGIDSIQELAGRKFQRKDKRGILEKIIENNGTARSIIFHLARKRTTGETRGNYPAPPRIIESVQYGYEHGFEAGLKNESELFGELAVTPESQALVRLFFRMTNSKKNPLGNPDKPVQNLAVLGAGLMGSGITKVSIDQGFHVWLKDQALEQSIEGEKRIFKELEANVKKGILSGFERDLTLSRIHPVSSYEGFRSIGLIIEAVFENLQLKQSIIEELEANTNPDCIIASNTSALPIREIASKAKRPENILGMHYFSPVQKMPLLEIIKTDKTDQQALAKAIDVGIRQGKSIIVVNDGPGFYTTRILAPYMNEALLLLEEGTQIEQIDKAIRNLGFPIGPVALFDEVGIDVGAHVAETLSGIFQARGAETSTKAIELAKAGFKGRKNKKGFYTYDKDQKKKAVNPDIRRFFDDAGRTVYSDHTIRERLLLAMINEAVYCYQENILLSPDDGDIGAILGLGFPPFLGGPFSYIKREGADAIRDRLHKLQQEFGNRFKPAELFTNWDVK